MDNFYTAQEVADILKIKKTTVYDLVKKKTLPATKVGKQIRIAKDDFHAYLAQYTENTEADPIKDTSDSIYMSRDFLRNNTGLILAGDEEVISAFYSYYRFHEAALPVIKQWGNLYDSLYSLYYGKVHGAFLPVIEEEEENLYQTMLPGMNVVSLPLAYVDYGIYIHKDLPSEIQSLNDLAGTSCRFAISEKGSFNRILFDKLVKSNQLERKQFSFTDKECISTIQAAMMIQKGQADATIGGGEVQDQFKDLTFIPLQKTCLKLVHNQKYASFPAFSAIAEILESDHFRRRMKTLGAYNTEDLGPDKVF